MSNWLPKVPVQAYRGPGRYLFVSYTHRDADTVYPELARLNDAGISVWYDEGISPGESWPQELAAAIDRCTAFLLFISPRSVLSTHCERELLYAIDAEKPVLAVHLEDTEFPSWMRLSLGNKQAVLKYRLPASSKRIFPERGAGRALCSIR